MRNIQQSPHVIQVIETELELRGNGTDASPYRRVRQYYSMEGELLAEVDPFPWNKLMPVEDGASRP